MSVAAPVPAAQPAALPRPRARRWSPTTRVLLAILAALVLVAILSTLIAPDDPTTGSVGDALGGWGAKGHLLGTDGQGRDMLSRLLVGSRLSLLTGITPVVFAGTVGTALGLSAGLAGRRVNALIMRTLDVFYSFPSILLAIAIGAVLGPSIRNVIIAISVVLIPGVARVVEAEVLALRGADFMRSAHCSGASRRMIAIRHVLPVIVVPVLVYCTSLVGLSIVEAAGLSFLGLGAAAPTAEWGLMLTNGQDFLLTNPSIALLPAVAILLVSLLFNALGNRLRVELDVRERDVL